MKALALALCLVALPAAADVVSVPDPDGKTVVLTDGPCGLPLGPRAIELSRHVMLKDKGGTVLFTGCYVRANQQVYVIWNDGDSDTFPDAMFSGMSRMRWGDI